MLPALGYEIANALDCSVVAMRYPVDDRFSAEFVRFYYQSVLSDGLPVGDAMRTARLAAHRAVPAAPLSAATPILLADDPDLRLIRPPIPSARAARPHPVPPWRDSARHRSRWPPIYSSAAPACLRGSPSRSGLPGERCGVVLVGMPGVGKSAACAEAAARYAAAFDHVILYRATRPPRRRRWPRRSPPGTAAVAGLLRAGTTTPPPAKGSSVECVPAPRS